MLLQGNSRTDPSLLGRVRSVWESRQESDKFWKPSTISAQASQVSASEDIGVHGWQFQLRGFPERDAFASVPTPQDDDSGLLYSKSEQQKRVAQYCTETVDSICGGQGDRFSLIDGSLSSLLDYSLCTEGPDDVIIKKAVSILERLPTRPPPVYRLHPELDLQSMKQQEDHQCSQTRFDTNTVRIALAFSCDAFQKLKATSLPFYPDLYVDGLDRNHTPNGFMQ
ncbi:hypothetical protein EV356DRAFT_46746 [Viridothelium virens]|uniref:Uncharacterized protein n=1 Tax=Viridothelium virens TaxID=1048519 RepID=A0A6A6GSL9_VIRVR|nr:hypothetical protein EV356DRAFT_46746 [Viridothelium virens]